MAERPFEDFGFGKLNIYPYYSWYLLSSGIEECYSGIFIVRRLTENNY
jgi:hypothetical protein